MKHVKTFNENKISKIIGKYATKLKDTIYKYLSEDDDEFGDYGESNNKTSNVNDNITQDVDSEKNDDDVNVKDDSEIPRLVDEINKLSNNLNEENKIELFIEEIIN